MEAPADIHIRKTWINRVVFRNPNIMGFRPSSGIKALDIGKIPTDSPIRKVKKAKSIYMRYKSSIPTWILG
jgi:hypothetical protein